MVQLGVKKQIIKKEEYSKVFFSRYGMIAKAR
jgi:hypothetical protein